MTPPPVYRADYRIRFDEADGDGLLRPSGFLRYAQDMAWRHSELAGFGREWYARRSMHWLVRNVTLQLREAVTYGDTLTVSTEVTGWRHVWARRHAEMRRTDSEEGPADGALVAAVDTDWVLLGLDGQPARVPPEIAEMFAAIGTFSRTRINLPETPSHAARVVSRVRPLDIDPMGHMNNAAYLDRVDEALAQSPSARRSDPSADRRVSPTGRPGSSAGRPFAPAGRPVAPDCYRVGYLRPAMPGSTIEVTCWPQEGGSVACRISDRDGEELTRVLLSWSEDPPAG